MFRYGKHLKAGANRGPRAFWLVYLVSLLMVTAMVTVGAVEEPERVGSEKAQVASLAATTLSTGLVVDASPTAQALAEGLLGTGPTAPTISNVTFTGDSRGAGSFTGGTGIIGFESGVVLGSGRVIDVVGPNTSDATTTSFGLPGDADLDTLITGFTTLDATVLKFDFDCPGGTSGDPVVSFSYVFTSEEYNEYVDSIYNDVFGFFLNGTNIALLPGSTTPVSINNVNNGFSLGGGLPGLNPSNPAFYINNDLQDGGGAINTEADGLTVVLGAEAPVNAGSNTIRLAIADAGDRILDSWVFIEAGSFVCAPLNQPPTADPNGPYLFPLNAGPFDGTDSSDPDGDPLTYDWDYGDGTPTDTDAGPTPSHTYAASGIYEVCLTVTDPAGVSDTACTYAVIYDPAGGFVTGGGWIDSPEGAYLADPGLIGKANFGFVSKYKKGANVPTGNTEFQFQTADLNFHSLSYDWLVVTGSDYAMFKGVGTINGEGEYRFMIWAGDDAPDTFRIKIWTEDEFGNETVVYDNGSDQPISGGNIVLHTK